MSSALRPNSVSALHGLWAMMRSASTSSTMKSPSQSRRFGSVVLAVTAAGFGTAASITAATASSDASQISLPTDKLACQLGATAPRAPVVLVACGSYNPPTYMHLRMFELAKQELGKKGYDVWGGYMSPVSDAYAKPHLAPAAQRLEMCRLASTTSGIVMVDAWEASRKEYTRTLQVLRHVRDELQKFLRMAGTEEVCYKTPKVMLLCGGDMLATMLVPGVWEDPATLLKEHGVVCVDRAGAEAKRLLETPGNLLYEHRQDIVLLEDPISGPVSSTLIRQQVAAGNSIKYLCTDGVPEYIAQHGLYQQ